MIDVSTTSTNMAIDSRSADAGSRRAGGRVSHRTILRARRSAGSPVLFHQRGQRGAGWSSSTAGTEGAAGAAAKPCSSRWRRRSFVMILDSSVMNVSIATVANDLGTTVTGIQTAITLYTLVMASLMITGGRMGAILGRKRAFHDRVRDLCRRIVHHRDLAEPRGADVRVVVPRSVGAALVIAAIVALVASNFVKAARPRAYGIVTPAARSRSHSAR